MSPGYGNFKVWLRRRPSTILQQQGDDRVAGNALSVSVRGRRFGAMVTICRRVMPRWDHIPWAEEAAAKVGRKGRSYTRVQVV